jgi:hypothetical protein
MFLATALKERSSPPENILKFDVPGGLMPLFRALKNVVARYAQ